ncbi:ATP-dependent DNA helicase DinG [Striga asiatica]|uniref:ATP-dependent DNA helicase DinG n=1 Tax=Striga asiatica TaxID=4170 RepID=A0A5A7QHB2_STRAF|nr:ATP-dependent DNA helicase DinG [Striga asiatica]
MAERLSNLIQATTTNNVNEICSRACVSHHIARLDLDRGAAALEPLRFESQHSRSQLVGEHPDHPQPTTPPAGSTTLVIEINSSTNLQLVEQAQLKRPLVEGYKGTNKRPCLEKAATVSLSAPPSLVKVGQEELVSYLREIFPAGDLNDDSLDLQTRGYRLARWPGLVELVPLVDQTVSRALDPQAGEGDRRPADQS